MTPKDIEIKLLLDAIYLKYGYDFKNYSEASLKRRVLALMAKHGIVQVSDLQHEVLFNPDFFALALPDLTVTTSEMFRDPSFFKIVREEVVPALKTYPSIKIWHAGCSTGEEVYSLAILLKEEGLYDRSVIYATDVNMSALKAAREGFFAVDAVKQFTENYIKSGGKQAFSDYYSALYGSAKFDSSLKENVVFTDHNLVVDEVFSETHLILCRNVLIYFNRTLQDRVFQLFLRSLIYGGYLCLGKKETVRFSTASAAFGDAFPREHIFKKILRDDDPSVAAEATL